MRNTQRGSIFFFILLGVIVFAAISATVMRMFSGGGDYGREEVAKLGAQALVEYAGKAKLTVQDMKLNGITVSNLSYLKSGDAGYTTAPHTNKVFHPNGGGLSRPDFSDILDLSKISSANQDIIYMSSVGATDVGTAARDVTLAVAPIKKDVCEQVEKNLYGTAESRSQPENFADTLGIALPGDELTCAPLANCVSRLVGCNYYPEGFYAFYAVIDSN